MFVIRQAQEVDIPAIEAMYQDVVLFQDTQGMHQWKQDEVTWKAFSMTYAITDYYVGVEDGRIVCGLFIVDVDALYWPTELKGSALYLHKICVHPKARRKGYADLMITFFKDMGKQKGYPCVRLDVRERKISLRKMYERNGFRYVKTGHFVAEFSTALYEFDYQKDS